MTDIPPKYPPSTDVGAYRPPKPNRLWQAILSFIDWLNKLAGAEKPKRKNNYQTLLVKKHKGIQVKHWSRYLFWVDVVVGFDENDEPILDGPELTVSQWDSDGNGFYPDGLFEIQRKPGKMNRIPYEWQPIAPKRKTNSEQMQSFGELFEEYEDVDREHGTEHIVNEVNDAVQQ